MELDKCVLCSLLPYYV